MVDKFGDDRLVVNVCYMYDVDSILNMTVDKSQCWSQCARRTMIRYVIMRTRNCIPVLMDLHLVTIVNNLYKNSVR